MNAVVKRDIISHAKIFSKQKASEFLRFRLRLYSTEKGLFMNRFHIQTLFVKKLIYTIRPDRTHRIESVFYLQIDIFTGIKNRDVKIIFYNKLIKLCQSLWNDVEYTKIHQIISKVYKILIYRLHEF